MDEINQLLDRLQLIHPLSLGFRKDLPLMLKKKKFKNSKVLLKKNARATKAWQVLNGYIIVIDGDQILPGSVKRIYGKGEIATDLESYYETTVCKETYSATGDLTTFELEKKNYNRLKKYSETETLAMGSAIRERNAHKDHVRLLSIRSIRDRVKAFLETNYTIGLPNIYAASYLCISEEEYLNEKCELQSMGIDFIQPNIELKEIAYQVKAYLKENMGSVASVMLKQISEHLFTSEKRVSRSIKKTFGVTAHKFLINLRIQRANQLLSQGVLIKEVARHVGYADEAAFSKIYKKHTGHCPKLKKGTNKND